MKICFMGTPDFALLSLQALISANYDVVAVYTKTPKPKGRGHKLVKSVVHEFAEENNIPVFTPKSLRNKEAQQEFIDQNFDLCVVASYGLILPKEILEAPKHGCINIHASLLPKLRGASPIQMAILQENKTGITTMQMDVGLDSGDILLQKEISITEDTTFLSLYNDLGIIGSDLIIETIKLLEKNQLIPIKQDESLVSHVGILKKEDGKLNFNESASLINRKIRAFNPYPTTYCHYKDELIKILATSVIKEEHNHSYGEIISLNPLKVACKQDILQIDVLQRQGKKAMKSEDLLRGFSISLGDVLT